MDIGASEGLIVLAVVALLFGEARIPELARSLGRSVAELRAGRRGDADDTGDRLAPA